MDLERRSRENDEQVADLLWKLLTALCVGALLRTARRVSEFGRAANKRGNEGEP